MPEKKDRRSSFFAESVDAITQDDIGCKSKKKKRISDIIFDNLRYVILFICAVVLIVNVGNIAEALKGYAEQNETYDNIGDFMLKGDGVEIMFHSPDVPVTPDFDSCLNMSDDELSGYLDPEKVNTEYERVRIKLANLKSRYPDLYGWIHVLGTNINYPVVQSTDNEYYLTHSYTGANLGAGAIFVDFTCQSALLDNRNLVIYGHHMSNNSMFHQLDNFLQEAFFRGNGKVVIYTLDGMYTYKIFSIYETNMYDPYINTYFSSDDQFVEFANRLQGNSIHSVSPIDFTGSSKILTMSTCNNRYDEGRLAVHAVMVESYQNKVK